LHKVLLCPIDVAKRVVEKIVQRADRHDDVAPENAMPLACNVRVSRPFRRAKALPPTHHFASRAALGRESASDFSTTPRKNSQDVVALPWAEAIGMSNRTALQTAIEELVDGLGAAGKVIDVNTAALQLSSKYPQSGMTIDEICRLIEQ